MREVWVAGESNDREDVGHRSNVPAGYRFTDVGWIPQDWCVCQLDSLGTGRKPPIKAGPFGSSLTKATYVSSGYKVYGQEQVIRGDPQYGDYYITRQKFLDLEACAVHPGDILMSLVGTVGKLLVVPRNAEPGIINPRLLRFSFDHTRILPLFFRFMFESEHLQLLLSRNMQGGTMGILNVGILRSLRIVVPPIAEQHAIATVLSDIDDLIGLLEPLIAKKRAIKQAVIQQLLTGRTRLLGLGGDWEVRRLGDLGTFSKGRGIARGDLRENGARCVRYGELYTRYENYVAKPKSRVPPDIADAALLIKKGDLLFAGSGETAEEIGICVAYIGEEPAYAGGDIIVLRASEQDAIYLAHLLNAPVAVRQKARMAQGDAIVHIRADHLAEVELPLPPLPEQRAIATVLSDMDAEIAGLEHRLDKTRAIKRGMMQQLLTGSIRLPIPDDATRDNDHDA